MSAASSVCSDDSFEIVDNELDTETPKDDASTYKPKITFHEVFDVYPMDADIIARITFDNDFVKSDQDTVVVLPIAWKSVDQALCAANVDGNHVRFDVKELPKVGADDKFYQLCYCTADKIVMGVSIPFSFREVHEDELVEFQKEQSKEFWTFRSRFAVLMDIYWNSLLENKPVQVVQQPIDVHSEEKVLDDDKDQKKSTDLENDRKILLFKIMETECRDLQLRFEEQQRKYEELEKEYEEKKKQYEMKNEFEDLNSHLKKVLEACKAEPNRSEVDILFTYDLASKDFKKFKESPFITQIISQQEPNMAEDEANKSTESTSTCKSEQNNNLTNSNAAFIATSSGDILVAEKCVQEAKSINKSTVTNTQKNAPEDWFQEKLKLWERCEELESEVVLYKAKVQELQETLINQRQSEVEKVITVTDNMRERYIKDVNKLKGQNAGLQTKLEQKDEELENLNKNILEMSKLLTENEDEIRNLKARDHSLVGFLERRNLKRISELEDRLHDLYSKMWTERKETIQLREDLLTSQALYNSLRDEKDKPSKENSTTENSVQTSSENKTETDMTENSAHLKLAAAHEYFYRVLQHHANSSNSQDMFTKPSCSYLEHKIQSLLDQPIPNHSDEECEMAPLKPFEVPASSETMTAELAKAKEKEEALAAKLVVVTAELEKMKELYAKTKTDLEARLKDGAKQYAKLYMKYMKRLGSSTPK